VGSEGPRSKGGWLRSGENGNSGKRAVEGKRMRKRDLLDAKEDATVGDGCGNGVAVSVGRCGRRLVRDNFREILRDIAVNIDGWVASFGFGSMFMVPGDFSNTKGGISSSGIGTRVLVR
jgi:hypothetical protein